MNQELDEKIYIYDDEKEPYLFVSYSHDDKVLVDKILQYLTKLNYRIWFDDAIGNEGEMNFSATLETKIKNSAGVILFISKSSMESRYCGREILTAYRYEKKIYPIALTKDKIDTIASQLIYDYVCKDKHVPAITDFENTDDKEALEKFIKFLPDDTCYKIEYEDEEKTIIKECKYDKKHIVLDDKVKKIGVGAFKECKKLEKIELKNVQSIGEEAFLNCENLIEIIIPPTVNMIGEYAFKDCEHAKKLIWNATNAVMIGDNAFDGCIALEEIELPLGLTDLSTGLFNGCKNLTKIKLPDSVVILGESAFGGCKKLQLDEEHPLPKHLKKIDDFAFVDCDELKEIKLPAELKKLGKNVFKDCSNLSAAYIDKEVSLIGSSPFRGCKRLEKIEVNKQNKHYKTTDNVLFNKNRSMLICHPANRQNESGVITKFEIPDSVTIIGDWAFADCVKLTSIIIPDSVDEIGENAFYKCKSISKLIIPEGVVKIDDMAFRGCTGLKQIVIPSTATQLGWGLFSGCKEVEVICEEGSAIADYRLSADMNLNVLSKREYEQLLEGFSCS